MQYCTNAVDKWIGRVFRPLAVKKTLHHFLVTWFNLGSFVEVPLLFACVQKHKIAHNQLCE